MIDILTYCFFFFYRDISVSYLIDIMKSARHATANNVATYQQDASTKFELNQRDRRKDSNRIGKFMSRHIEADTYGVGTSFSTPFQKSLPLLAQWWYDKCLRMEGKPFSDPKVVLDIALLRRRADGASTVDLSTIQSALSTHIRDNDVLNALMRQVRQLTVITSSNDNSSLLRQIQDLQAAQPRPDIRAVLAQRTRRNAPPPPVPTSSLSTDLPRGSIPLSIEGFAALKSTDAKIAFLRTVHNEFLQVTNGGDKEALLPAHKRWYNRYVPILHCLAVHHNDNVESFKLEYNCPNNFAPSKWICTCGM